MFIIGDRGDEFQWSSSPDTQGSECHTVGMRSMLKRDRSVVSVERAREPGKRSDKEIRSARVGLLEEDVHS